MLNQYRNFKGTCVIFAALALLLAMEGCSRRYENASEPAPKPVASVAPQTPAAPVSSDKSSAAAEPEPQPDFTKYPPLHLKPPCTSSIGTAANDGNNRCFTLTLRCTELDQGESVWLATTPPIAKVKVPEGAKGLRVTTDDEVSATVCCKGAADGKPVPAKLKLFTNEVVGSTHEFECPATTPAIPR